MSPEPHASRQYIDLIHAAETKWANWDPPVRIEVGDYGIVDPLTGAFARQGNIYKEPRFARIIPNLDSEHQPIKGPESEGSWMIPSSDVRRVDVSAHATSGVPGMDLVTAGGEWQFGRDRGALLVIWRQCHITMPTTIPVDLLIADGRLKGCSLVTEVVRCPAYARVLSNKNHMSLSLLLKTAVPPSDGRAVLGLRDCVSWEVSQNSGNLRAECSPDGSYIYTPLFVLKDMEKKEKPTLREAVFGHRMSNASSPVTGVFEFTPSHQRRGSNDRRASEGKVIGPDSLRDTLPPWGELNSDGREIRRRSAEYGCVWAARPFESRMHR